MKRTLWLILSIIVFSSSYVGAMEPDLTAVVPIKKASDSNGFWGTCSKLKELVFNIPGALKASKDAVDKLHKISEDLPDKVTKETEAILKRTDETAKKTIEQLESSISTTLLKAGAVTVGVVTAFFVSRIIWSMVHDSLKNPRLVRKTSRKNWLERLNLRKSTPEESIDLVFAPDLQDELQRLIVATKWITHRIKQGDKVHYRSLFLYGPPGTGKTKFAEKLSYESGMEYALMSGSDILSANPGQLNELFEWAHKSKKGVILFIDEADALLAVRDTSNVDSPHYQQLSRFLNYTSGHSNKFMVIFATNNQHIIDPAIGRRVEDEVEFKLPEYHQRIDILELYCKKLLFDEAITSKELSESARRVLDAKKLAAIAKSTNGLSGAELESIINIIKTDSEIAPDGVVKEWIVDKAVKQMILKHQKFSTGFKVPAVMSIDVDAAALAA